MAISTAYRLSASGSCWVLRLDGRLDRDGRRDLRDAWRLLRSSDERTPIRVEVDGTSYVDRLGRLLLAEMHAAGVSVAWPAVAASLAAPAPGDRHERRTANGKEKR